MNQTILTPRIHHNHPSATGTILTVPAQKVLQECDGLPGGRRSGGGRGWGTRALGMVTHGEAEAASRSVHRAHRETFHVLEAICG